MAQIDLHSLIPSKRIKYSGYQFWDHVLNKPKYILGPMVDGSELAFRIFAKRHGAHLTYSPMLYSSVFAVSEKYRRNAYAHSLALDFPSIVQFCGTDPDIFLKAALLIQDQCCAVDINMGCPQGCARKSGYGSFLLDKPELAYAIVKNLHQNLDIPVTCKIRLIADPDRNISIEKTIEFCLGLQKHGCQVLTIHGRNRDQKGKNTIPSDWAAIREIKKCLNIPVIANGSIEKYSDIERCLQESQADAVMVAYPLLINPYLFENIELTNSTESQLKRVETLREYFEICHQHSTGRKYMDFHVFSLLQFIFQKWRDLIKIYKKSRKHEQLISFLDEVEKRLKEDQLTFY